MRNGANGSVQSVVFCASARMPGSEHRVSATRMASRAVLRSDMITSWRWVSQPPPLGIVWIRGVASRPRGAQLGDQCGEPRAGSQRGEVGVGEHVGGVGPAALDRGLERCQGVVALAGEGEAAR